MFTSRPCPGYLYETYFYSHRDPVPTQEDHGPLSDVVETERQQRAAVQTKRHKKKKNFVPQHKPDVSPLIRNFISKAKP